MKSFRLHVEGRRDLVQSAIGLVVGAGLLGIAAYGGFASVVMNACLLVTGAIFVGYLCRGQMCRVMRTRYPNARWIPLLAIGMSILTFGVIARFIVPHADEGWFTLAFILPAGACIAVFVVINRHDPDVTK